MVATFKFGKKKSKDSTPSNTPSRDTSFSSPSSSTAKTPAATTAATAPLLVDQGSPLSSTQSLNSQRKNSNTLGVEKQSANGIQYDHNNNLRSPQRPPQSFYRNTSQGTPRKTSQTNPPFPHQLVQPWSKAKLLISPFPRYRHTASTVSNDRGEIFVMGGLHNTSVYGDTWLIKQDNGKHFQTLQVEITENSPVPRVGHASTTCGNAYVIFGGDTVSNQDGEIDNDLYLFNMNSHTWSVPKPMGKKPSGRYGHKIGVIAITNYDSKVYLFGGQLDDNIFDDLAVFNLSSFRRPDVQWEWVTPSTSVKPPGLTNHTMDVYDNKLWVFGGFNGKSLDSDLWCFDPVSTSWSLVKTYGTAPPPLEEHASVVYGDLLIIHGGKKSDGEASRDLFFYNFVNKSWFKLPSSFTNFPGKFGHTISILNKDKLVLLGGQLPDYAKLGEAIEPTMDDQGVGTILNILDLSNLNKLIPGLQPLHQQEPLTPNTNGEAERFISSQPTAPFNSLKSPVSLNRSSEMPPVNAPAPDFKGHHRGLSAEDIFKRDHQDQPRVASQYAGNGVDDDHHSADLGGVDVEDAFSQESPLKHRNSGGNAVEEELPLVLPSPIETKDSRFENQEPIVADSSREETKIDHIVTSIPSTDKNIAEELSRKPSTAGTSIVAGVAGLAGLTAGLTAGVMRSKDETVDGGLPIAQDQLADIKGPLASDVNAVDANTEEKKQFQDMIQLLSSELKNLKMSTSEKIKEASDKIIQLEEENGRLREQQPRDLNKEEPLNENEIKRRNHRLNSEYTILSQSHANLQSQYEEMKPIFSENLIDLSKLNDLVKEQSQKIVGLQTQLDEQENWKVKFEQLQVQFNDLEGKNLELRNAHDDRFYESQDYIKQLNTGLESFLQKYVTKDQETGTVEVKDGSPKATVSDSTNGLVESLRAEIESLITDNEAFEAKTNTLSSEIEQLQKQVQTTQESNTEQVTSLKAKEEELITVRAKLVELDTRYKNSLHSVTNSAKALQLSESELSKQRDLNKTLLNDLEEMKLKKSASRNVTPIINDFKKRKSMGTSGLQGSTEGEDHFHEHNHEGEEEEEEEEDFENSHFNLTIRDLQAELYIIKQERDELKENVLKLKKDLFIANQKKNQGNNIV